MAKLHYHLVDVFTDRQFGGNQLAVFTDGQSVDPRWMQAIARELNLSETTFVLPPDDPQAQFRVRIFTPGAELPMAGHPTVGTGFVLRHLGMITGNSVIFEEGVGLIPVDLSDDGRVTMTQPTPKFGAVFDNREVTAAMLSIEVNQLAEGLPIQVVSSGVPFVYVPVRDLAAIRQVKLRQDLWEKHFTSDVFVFTMETELPGSTVHSRMFAPGLGISEDPATGGASGPLGAYLVQYGLVKAVDGRYAITSEQGIEMGRPSKIYIDVDGDTFKVGGYTQLMGGGYLEI